MRLYGHAGVKLLDSFGFEELDLGRDLLVEALGQKVPDLFHHAEGQVVLDVDVRCVELVAQVFCRPVELVAHNARLVYRLEQARLAGGRLGEFHASLLDLGQFILLPFDASSVVLDNDFVVIHHILHLLLLLNWGFQNMILIHYYIENMKNIFYET